MESNSERSSRHQASDQGGDTVFTVWQKHLLTDAYSRMIVGNRVVQGGLIHHSDRGCQYCCERYVKLYDSGRGPF